MSEVTASLPLRNERPPGPRGLRLLRALLDYRQNALGTMEKMVAEYGDVTYFPLPGGGAYLLGHPDLVQQVLIRNVDNYHKTTASRWSRHFFGNAMQINNGEYAKQMRRIVAPAFHGEGLANAYGELIVRETAAVVSGWRSGHNPRITQDITDAVLSIVMQIFFGTAPGPETREMGELYLSALPPTGTLLPHWVPGSRNRRYVAATKRLDEVVLQRIADRRREGATGSDFLSVLVRLGGGKDGHTLSDRQIRDELVVYALAGYSATTSVNQVVRLVAENPEVDARFAAELAQVVGDREPQIHDLPKLAYLSMIMKEALRLCPPAGLMFRRAVGDDVIAGWKIPAGSRLFLSSWVIQRDRRFFDDPLAFKPERWTPEFERALPTCAYFPFGRGPRACIGGAMGELILALMAATINSRYRLTALRKLEPDQAEWPALLAAGGVQADVQRRT